MSRYDPEQHHRRSIRLRGYDYSQPGAYFITIVTQGWLCLFGDVADGVMVQSTAGQMIESAWLDLPSRFRHIELEAYVVMPNHLHGIIIIHETDPHPVGATLVVAHEHVVAPENAVAADNAQCSRTNDQPHGSARAGTSPAPTGGHTVTTDTRAGARAGTSPAPTGGQNPTVGAIVGAFKSITTMEYIRGVNLQLYPPFDRRLWQRNYYEHIIRNEHALRRIREYIWTNPLRWALDRENAQRIGVDESDTWLHEYYR